MLTTKEKIEAVYIAVQVMEDQEMPTERLPEVVQEVIKQMEEVKKDTDK